MPTVSNFCVGATYSPMPCTIQSVGGKEGGGELLLLSAWCGAFFIGRCLVLLHVYESAKKCFTGKIGMGRVPRGDFSRVFLCVLLSYFFRCGFVCAFFVVFLWNPGGCIPLDTY